MCCHMAVVKTFHKFVLLLSVIILVKTVEARSSTNGIQEMRNRYAIENFTSNRCKVVHCRISCFNGNEVDIYYDIKAAIMQNDISYCKIFDELHIYNYTFEDRKIPQKWTPIQEKVKSLKIILSDIETIEERAFQNLDLAELSLQNLKLKQLDSFVLFRLRNLEKLEIKQTTTETLNIAFDFLTPVQFSLIELTINANLHSPVKFTERYAHLKTLIKIDLSYNNFNILKQFSFIPLTDVEHLNLSHSNISVIESGVFIDLSDTLRFLDLSHNQLVKFSPSIFKLPLSSVKTSLILKDNPWECTCRFQEILQMLHVNEIHKVVCHSPVEYFNMPILQANMLYCEDTGIEFPGEKSTTVMPSLRSSTTVSAGTSETTNIPPESSEDLYTMLNLECKVCKGLGPYCNMTTINPEFITIPVKPNNLDFSITRISDTSVAVEIKNAPPIQETYSVLWFSRVTKDFFKTEVNYKENGLGCFRNINRTIYVHGLYANSTYIFCLIFKHYSLTSPLNCKGYRLSNYYREGAKILYISLTVFSIIFSMFLGGAIVFSLIKRKPRLLCNSKRVYKPKKSSSDIMVLPRAGSLLREMQGHCNPCFVPNSRLRLQRSLSDDSSYILTNYYEIIPSRINQSCPFEDGNLKRRKRRLNDPLPEIPGNNLSNCIGS